MSAILITCHLLNGSKVGMYVVNRLEWPGPNTDTRVVSREHVGMRRFWLVRAGTFADSKCRQNQSDNGTTNCRVTAIN